MNMIIIVNCLFDFRLKIILMKNDDIKLFKSFILFCKKILNNIY